MENRVLVIGDELFGPKGEAANRFVEAVLCWEPSRPIQFSLNVPIAVSLSQLKARLSSDVIGKNAGRIIVGLGLRELNQGGADGASVANILLLLVNELVNKTQSRLFLLTIPSEMFPIAVNEVEFLNTSIREIIKMNENRIVLLDFAKYAEEFKEKQMARGKFGRSLFMENGEATSLCCMLLALYLQEKLVEDLKEM
ncbi:hypothetical protein [Fibrobacter succinogenes]|uniref:hypothetical protein n=1 Tax=Fibrobacter succinogenes TaxID=833 RepID=UPI001568371C|nr:hypothetical protein [Fibrobacter succinogenes]